MGVLPDAGLWNAPARNNSRSREHRPERPRSGKRMFHDSARKDGVSLASESHDRGKSPNSRSSRLQRRNSEPSIASSQDLSARHAAGCRQSRMNDIRADCPHNLGRHKQRTDVAHVESVGLSNEADRLHEFRYYLDPSQKRLGPRLGNEEQESNQRPCAQHRYYQDPDERIVGQKKLGAVGAKPDSMGEILHGKLDSDRLGADNMPLRKCEAIRYCPEAGRGLGKRHVDPGVLHADGGDAFRFSEPDGENNSRPLGRKHCPEDERKMNPILGTFEPSSRSQGSRRKQGRGYARSVSPDSTCSFSTFYSSYRAKTPPPRLRDSESTGASSSQPRHVYSRHKPRARTPPPRWDDSDSLASAPQEGKARLIYSRNSGTSTVSGSSFVSANGPSRIPNRPLRHSEIAGLLTPTETTVSGYSSAPSQ